MKTIIDRIKLDKIDNKLYSSYFDNRTLAVFDIETTGLSPSNSRVILTALLTFDDEFTNYSSSDTANTANFEIKKANKDSNAKVIQFFAESIEDEKEVIEKTIEILESHHAMLTYNGKSFDLPFIKQRAIALGIPWTLDSKYNLDLYPAVRNYSTLNQTLPNLKQKSIEMFMDVAINRDDEISGAESVNMYNQYLRTKDPILEEKILLHNHDDVIQLYKILPVINFIDFHGFMSSAGFLGGNYKLESINLSKENLILTGLQLTTSDISPVNYIGFPSSNFAVHTEMSASPNKFTLTIPVEKDLNSNYIDLELFLDNPQILEKYPAYVNRYLILRENGVIDHMSVNGFILELLKTIDKKINIR